ncbi:hypothetical protein XU18_4947 [Perkinsela sp. CCAP 1560/4]|nr:hypothetical protein XU18_4947 [Perkinsela sp. CCAP 1560/4]|eukprot:KNH03713.1 hypothetical protein XU18_4947 [Perkinsela sp. CCAP 1560/4]
MKAKKKTPKTKKFSLPVPLPDLMAVLARTNWRGGCTLISSPSGSSCFTNLWQRREGQPRWLRLWGPTWRTAPHLLNLSLCMGKRVVCLFKNLAFFPLVSPTFVLCSGECLGARLAVVLLLKSWRLTCEPSMAWNVWRNTEEWPNFSFSLE